MGSKNNGNNTPRDQRELKKRLSRPMQENECMFPDCDKGIQCRGLCHNHYTAARRGVNRGDYTWEQLVENGLALPKKDQTYSPMREALKKRRGR